MFSSRYVLRAKVLWNQLFILCIIWRLLLLCLIKHFQLQPSSAVLDTDLFLKVVNPDFLSKQLWGENDIHIFLNFLALPRKATFLFISFYWQLYPLPPICYRLLSITFPSLEKAGWWAPHLSFEAILNVRVAVAHLSYDGTLCQR